MARFYSDENFALPVVEELRRLGHDVLTASEAGNANARVPDPEVLAFALSRQRILLTQNRRDFLRLHLRRTEGHFGVVLCTFDPDFVGQAQRIDAAVAMLGDGIDQVVRVNRPG